MNDAEILAASVLFAVVVILGAGGLRHLVSVLRHRRMHRHAENTARAQATSRSARRAPRTDGRGNPPQAGAAEAFEPATVRRPTNPGPAPAEREPAPPSTPAAVTEPTPAPVLAPTLDPGPADPRLLPVPVARPAASPGDAVRRYAPAGALVIAAGLVLRRATRRRRR